MDWLSWSKDMSSKSRQSETAFETREWPKTLVKRDKMEMTFCKTVITSSAELANLVEETLRDEPTKSLGEEADVEY